MCVCVYVHMYVGFRLLHLCQFVVISGCVCLRCTRWPGQFFAWGRAFVPSSLTRGCKTQALTKVECDTVSAF